MSQQIPVILHAPNVHTGGGKVLLDAVLLELQRSRRLKACILDERYIAPALEKSVNVIRFRRSFGDRLRAEICLRRIATHNDLVFCFGNLPPLFNIQARVKLLLQNRNLLPKVGLSEFSLKLQVRILIERIWLQRKLKNVHEVIVQSVAMQEGFLNAFPEFSSTSVSVKPFLPSPISRYEEGRAGGARTHTFLYVASGDAHKNHVRLIRAWERLARSGFYPVLLLTLDERIDRHLISEIERAKVSYKTEIKNLGRIFGNDLAAAYKQSSALIFPSYSESFGIPLYEALSYQLPILASEMDFVRDVTNPEESFDPYSERSIADAVMRYMGATVPKKVPVTETEFCLGL